jgi:hypothetical protein
MGVWETVAGFIQVGIYVRCYTGNESTTFKRINDCDTNDEIWNLIMIMEAVTLREKDYPRPLIDSM